MKVLLLLLPLLLVSCATRTPVTDKLTRRSSLPESVKISRVPAIEQKAKQCGPASLAMVLQHHGVKRSPEVLARDLFRKELGGSFRSDILASARREGMMAMELGNFKKVLEEVSAGHPVIVFQNVGFTLLPQYHFSVLRGYDLDGPDVIINSGKDHSEMMDMRLYERSWILGGEWAAVILPPDKLSQTNSELEHVEAASLLEASGKLPEAKLAYTSILTKWPQSHLALIGASNIAYSEKKLKTAEDFLLKATASTPTSAVAWHNLALVQGELGKLKAARASAKKAHSLADAENEPLFKVSLKKFL